MLINFKTLDSFVFQIHNVLGRLGFNKYFGEHFSKIVISYITSLGDFELDDFNTTEI